MQRVFIVAVAFLSILVSCRFAKKEPVNSETKQMVKPKFRWEVYKNPEDAGFSKEAIQEIEEYFDKTEMASLFVVNRGKVLLALGEYQRRFNCHSVRKSLMNAVVGIGYDEGKIDLNKSLADLEIDDLHKLCNEEKQATIRQILQSRSGIYHPAVYETGSMTKSKPVRNSMENGTHWYYNNWDFNVLSTIVQQEMGNDFLSLFSSRIAEPLGMEDYREFDGNYYVDSTVSYHKAYGFKLSARDLARFGLLYLQKGVWEGQRILSEDWIKQSITPYSDTKTARGGYGYLWWIPKIADKYSAYAACGVGTQVLLVIPELDLVIVQRVNTYLGKQHPFDLKLYEMIVNAKVRPGENSLEFASLPPVCQLNSYTIESKEDYVGLYKGFDGIYMVSIYDSGLIIEYPKGLKSLLIQEKEKDTFSVEDINEIIKLEKPLHFKSGKLSVIGLSE
jgi:CubicO group peptidase (beta-lactamase class C family)